MFIQPKKTDKKKKVKRCKVKKQDYLGCRFLVWTQEILCESENTKLARQMNNKIL